MTEETLRRALEAKFDEICAFLAAHYGLDPDPAKLSNEKRAQIADEAEELTENWDTACFDDWELQARTELQRLLAAHHEIRERILVLWDEKFGCEPGPE
jgi:hypothetical protein